MERAVGLSIFEVLWAAASAAGARAYDALQVYAEARGRAAALRELERLSDHMLRDIGVHRSELAEYLRNARNPW